MSGNFNFFKSLLLYENVSYLNSATSFSEGFLIILPVVLIVATLMYYIFNQSMDELGKGVVISVAIILMYTPIHIAFVETSFDLVAELMSDSFKNNEVFAFITKTSKDASVSLIKVISYTLTMSGESVNPLNAFALFVAMIALMLTKCLYTVVYCTAPFFALIGATIGLVPFAKESLFIGFKTTLWCIVTPFVTGGTLLVLLDTLYAGGKVVDGKIVLEGTDNGMALFVTSLFLLGSCWVSKMIITGTGLDGWASNISKGASHASLFKATGALMGSPQRIFGGATGTLRNLQSFVGGRANDIMSLNGIRPSSNSLSSLGSHNIKNGAVRSFFNGIGDSAGKSPMVGVKSALDSRARKKWLTGSIRDEMKEKTSKLHAGERMIVGLDSVLNRGANKRAMFNASKLSALNSDTAPSSFRPVHNGSGYVDNQIKLKGKNLKLGMHRSSGQQLSNNPYHVPEAPTKGSSHVRRPNMKSYQSKSTSSKNFNYELPSDETENSNRAIRRGLNVNKQRPYEHSNRT
jgi:hypothetical protein